MNYSKRKARNYSIVGLICVVIILVKMNFNHKSAKEDYYNSIDDYAFELVECNQGANHYGEREYYKFFTNGTGLYLFISWHDSFECSGDCNLSAQTDTLTFRYHVNGDTIFYPRWIMSYPIMAGEISPITVNLMKHSFDSDELGIRFIDTAKVDWNKVNEMFDNQ